MAHIWLPRGKARLEQEIADPKTNSKYKYALELVWLCVCVYITSLNLAVLGRRGESRAAAARCSDRFPLSHSPSV